MTLAEDFRDDPRAFKQISQRLGRYDISQSDLLAEAADLIQQ